MFDRDPAEFRMKVHLFGASSSPGCANFALKQTAEDFRTECGVQAAEFVRKNFYVDDGLQSVVNPSIATNLIKESTALCLKGGFKLHKFISNNKKVIDSIPPKQRAKGIQELDLSQDDLPVERTLGVQWCVESDAFQFKIELKDRPLTTQGIQFVNSTEPLSPSNLLTMKSKLVLPPPGVFQKADLYSRKRWRRVQHLANEFWKRWRTEFLLEMQRRSKWTKPKKNLNPGDIVIIKDDAARRNQWQLARIMESYVDADGLVRKVKLILATSALDERGRRNDTRYNYIERPVHKLVLILSDSS